MKEITTKDIDFIHNIINDIEILYKLGASNENLATNVRMASVILRRLILDHELKRAASFIQYRLELRKTCELLEVAEYNKKNIQMAHTAYSKLGGFSYNGFTSTDECLKLDYRNDSKTLFCSCDEFMKQKTIYYYGEYLTRSEILRYAANKMGGAHHGNKKIPKEGTISKAMGSLLFKPLENGKFSIALETTRLQNLNENTYPSKSNLNLVHLELLSAARLISHSSTIQNLSRQLEKLIEIS